MTPESSDLITSVVLSREELLFILNLLNVGLLPGIQVEPIGELSPEQQAYGLIAAERALRARGLARIDEKGDIQVRNDVLDLVGTCAYAQGVFVVSLVESTSARGETFVAFRRNDHFVLQSSPESELFLFQTQPSSSDALSVALEMCRLPASSLTDLAPIVADQQVVVRVRECAQVGDIEKATSLLTSESASPASVDSFVGLLVATHWVAVCQNIAFEDEDSALVQSTTLLFDDEYIWLAVENSPQSGEDAQTYTLRSAALASVTTYLSSLQW